MHNKWSQDLIKDIRDFTFNDDNDDMTQRCSVEASDCNRNALQEQFFKVRDCCKAILEIGVCRNGDQSFTHVFLKNKRPETVYIGVDINDKSFLDDPSRNIFTIQSDSSDYNRIVEFCRSKGVEQLDFIFIDGWHSINQVMRDWEFTNLLGDRGIVGFHDTAYHYGPNRFVNNLNTERWHVIPNACNHTTDDYGIGFAWKKHNTQFYDPSVEIAVLISGQLRTAEKCIDSINRMVLSRIGRYDLYACVASDQDSHKLGLFKPKKAIVTEQPWLDEKDYTENNLRIRDIPFEGARPLISGTQSVLRQFWFLKEVNNLKTQAELSRNKKYKWVIRLRPDTMFNNNIEDLTNLNPDRIYIPKFSNFFGYNDRFAYGSSELMDIYNNRLDMVDICPDFHPESILKYCLDSRQVKIDRTGVDFYTVRPNDLVYPYYNPEFGDVL